MSPFPSLPFLFLVLFASLSHVSFGRAVERSQKVVIQRELQEHNEPAEDSAVLPRSSSRKQQIAQKLLQASLKEQEQTLTSSMVRDDGAFLISSSTVVKRQIEDAELVQCEDNERLFRVEVTTDRYPTETSWSLMDVSNNTVVLEKEDFDKQDSIYIEKKCLESNLCYQFTINDSAGNGLDWPRSYEVQYDNQIIKERGRRYGDNEESEFFGDGGPSSSLSQSQNSTISRMSSTPSLSFEPSSSPTELQDYISYGYDDLNRRLFPSLFFREDMPKSIVSYQTWPNCSVSTTNE